MNNNFEVVIYTDGACSGNPGVGGWGTIITLGDYFKEFSGAEPIATNNRMELLAVIKGLSALKQPVSVKLYSDSAYVVNAFELKWIDGWQQNKWKNASGDAVKNRDLWQELLELTKKHNVQFIKVKGHADNELNNRCDSLATTAIKEYIAAHPEIAEMQKEASKQEENKQKITKKEFDSLVGDVGEE